MRDLYGTIIRGTIGKNAELKTTQSGKTFIAFSVATNKSFKNKQTGKFEVEPTKLHRVICWNNTLQPQNLASGERIQVIGIEQVREFQDQNGERKTIKEIIAAELMPLPKLPQKNTNVSNQVSQPNIVNSATLTNNFATEDSKDIPF